MLYGLVPGTRTFATAVGVVAVILAVTLFLTAASLLTSSHFDDVIINVRDLDSRSSVDGMVRLRKRARDWHVHHDDDRRAPPPMHPQQASIHTGDWAPQRPKPPGNANANAMVDRVVVALPSRLDSDTAEATTTASHEEEETKPPAEPETALEIKDCLSLERRLIWLGAAPAAAGDDAGYRYYFTVHAKDMGPVCLNLVYNCGFGLSKERRYERKRRGWGGNLDTAPGGFTAHRLLDNRDVTTTEQDDSDEGSAEMRCGENRSLALETPAGRALLFLMPVFQQRELSYMIMNDERIYTDTARLVSLLGVNRAMPAEAAMSGRVAADPSIVILPYFSVRECSIQIEGGRPQLAQARTLSFRRRDHGNRRPLNNIKPLATTFLPCAASAIENAQMAPGDGAFDTAAKQLLGTAKQGLDALGIEFWVNSGTLLGWLRECGFIPHSRDVDVGVFADDFDQERLDELIAVMAGLKLRLSHRFGTLSDAFELSFQSEQGLKLDMFFFYINGTRMFNCGTQARTGKKFIYTFPRHTLCWAQLAGMLVRVPCDTEPFVAANYGSDWRTPVEAWDWKLSPPNVAPYGRWPPDTWARTIQCDVCPNQVNLDIPYT